MKKILFFGMGLLVLIGGIFVISELVGNDNYENIAVNELDDITYGVQYTSEESSEILFKGFVENTSGESLTIDHGVFFTGYKVFDLEGNEVKDVQERSGDYASILYMTSIEQSERLIEEMHTILELPKGEYIVQVQFDFEVSKNREMIPTEVAVVISIE